MGISKKSGFTLVEVLIVVAIIALLAGISAPGYLQVLRRARAPEGIATMSTIRQALRDYFINHGAYFDIASGNIDLDLPPASPAGVAHTVGIAHYFSEGAFSVDSTLPAWTDGAISPGPVDFVISVDGDVYDATLDPTAPNIPCTNLVTTNCAMRADRVETFRLEMDNTGRVFISYDEGSTWVGY